ncbi:amino acid-binding protein [Arthrobacter globiformis]|uniref:amino acid-binding protein n=1 Tax=Arthrobacter globiformis TaxID=1665 RepID=UPI00397C3228
MKPHAPKPLLRNRHAPNTAAELSCEVCGQMPEPTKTRLTVANVAVMLPIELLVHALVVQTHLPYLAKVLVLTLTATVLVIWVAEPSAARILRRWLHAPALRHRRRLGTAPALWRARIVLRDEPGSLKRITRSLALLDTNILGIHVHPVRGGVMDEFVLSAPGGVGERQLLEALMDGGGRSAQVWPTTALAMADGQTKALSLAARIAATPAELPLAVAELLSARILEAGSESARACAETNDAGTLLRIPTAWHGPITFVRPGEPFTPAESARAHRLAELAEILAHREAGLISGPGGSPGACSAPCR